MTVPPALPPAFLSHHLTAFISSSPLECGPVLGAQQTSSTQPFRMLVGGTGVWWTVWKPQHKMGKLAVEGWRQGWAAGLPANRLLPSRKGRAAFMCSGHTQPQQHQQHCHCKVKCCLGTQQLLGQRRAH